MKNLLFIAFLSVLTINAQETIVLSPNTITIGDILTLGKPSGKTYKHIIFPRSNFIIKKGGTTNFKNLEGLPVIITSTEVRDEKTIISIKRKDGKQFLNSIRIVNVDFKAALNAKEIFQ
ncbi:hypothetical protein SAMN04487910_3898 [Aquimarina amphilecti]|uniref:Uncharacterized protein n=1 Tax=Aquimarina amphilecti TaxID=1038014 RepID=A0A1H7UW67_AQUAM|nr:hypothetical protein [Aquimarina amphilecti]SEM00935.1 hypothetical protein SAMN04487910_3898 [Aquimarina amphilecti]